MEIKSLSGLSFTTIYKAASKAFSDYDAPSMTEAELRQMLTRRGFNQDLSLGAFIDNQLISFTNNGIGSWDGKLTAYDTGTATVKEFRQKGIAKEIFKQTEVLLKDQGIEQYLLEVLQHNPNAIDLYRKVGFEVTRSFDYFVAESKSELNLNKANAHSYITKELKTVPFEMVQEWWDFTPAWQNSIDSIHRNIKGFKFLGTYDDHSLIGYSIIEPNTGDITQIGVSPSYRRKGIASNLIKEAMALISSPSIKLVNSETDKSDILPFLKSMGLERLGQQYEMIKPL